MNIWRWTPLFNLLYMFRWLIFLILFWILVFIIFGSIIECLTSQVYFTSLAINCFHFGSRLWNTTKCRARSFISVLFFTSNFTQLLNLFRLWRLYTCFLQQFQITFTIYVPVFLHIKFLLLFLLICKLVLIWLWIFLSSHSYFS